jgi:hypothetical protein
MPYSPFASTFSSRQYISSNPRRILLGFLAILLALSLGASVEIAAGQTKRRSGARRGGAVKRPPIVEAPVIDDNAPLDPAIVAESLRLERHRLEQQQKSERELVAKADAAQTRQEDLWRGYRQTFPFHSQVIALSEPAADESRTLIVSEPPAHVRLEDILTSVGNELLLNHQVKKHKMGYDGWVKDVVIAIKGNEEQVQAMLSRLNQRLFFTSYKSYTLKLPAQVRMSSFDLNLSVTPDELNQWIVVDREQFFPIEGGPATALANLSAEQSSSVYVSHRRGLIGWWIPKKRNLYECRIPARQFALDADLIVGAVANESGTFVLGRERIVPIDILPPLRFETLTLLADVQKGQMGHLAQSYERNRPYAGRIGVDKDWAPILLSPELRDTEYGSLLNITDQLLKGWSNKGDTKYENFPYSAPGKYPFPKPLWEHLDVSTLTYNWNTKGAGFTVNFGPLTYLALNRTGSLPVSYIPEGVARTDANVIAAEDTGYDYFASIGDPNLARVVQYAAAYQIFSAFDVAPSPKAVPADSYPDELLESLIAELDTSLKGIDGAELDNLTKQLVPPIRGQLEEGYRDTYAAQLEKVQKEIQDELKRKGWKPGTKEYIEKFESVFSQVKNDWNDQIERKLHADITEQLTAIKLNVSPKDKMGETFRKVIRSQFASIRRLPERYAEAIDGRAKGWIHTPVVVISTNEIGTGIGGHNLDARVSKIKVDDSSAPGQVQIDQSGAIVVNPIDLARVRGMARNVERNDLFRELAVAANQNDTAKFELAKQKIGVALRSAEPATMRPFDAALQFTPPPNKPPTNKPPISLGEPSGAGGAGWGRDGRSSFPLLVERRRGEPSIIRIKANDTRFDVEYSIGDGNRAYTVKGLTHEDAVDVAARQAELSKGGEIPVFEFEGFSEQRATATLQSIEIQMGHRGPAIETIGRLVSAEPMAPTMGKYSPGSAKVELAEVKTLSTGEMQQDLLITVPDARTPNQSVTFRSQIKFNSWTPREVISAVTEKLRTNLNALAQRWNRVEMRARFDANVENYHKDLARSLKKMKAKTKLDFDVKTTVEPNVPVNGPQLRKDIYIGKKELRSAESEAGTNTD